MDLDKLSQIVEEMNLYNGKADLSKLRSLVDRYAKTYDRQMGEFILSQIQKELFDLKRRALISVNQGTTAIRSEDADMRIGKIGNSDFFLSSKDFNRNILITGSVGHGKTTLVAAMLRELIKKNINFLVFDIKRDYWSLALNKDTFCVDVRKIKINPLEAPPNVDLKEWAVHVADFFAHSFSLLIGSRDFLLLSLLSLYSQWKHEYSPSLSDLSKFIELQVKPNEYSTVVLNRLRALTSSNSFLDCNHGLLLDKFADKNLILGIDKLGLAEQKFVASYFLSFLYFLNMNSNHRNKLQKVVVIDDAHSLLDVNQEMSKEMGIPLLHTIIAKAREFGIGFVFADQQVSSLLSTAIENTNTKFIGRTNLVNELGSIIDSSALQEAQDKIRSLGVGEFLVVSPSVSSLEVMKADNVVLDKGIDQSILEMKNLQHKELFSFIRYSDSEERTAIFIKELLDNPFANISQHIKNLSGSINRDGFLLFRNELFHDDLIYEVKIKLDENREAKFLYVNEDKKERVMKLLYGDPKPIENNREFRQMPKVLSRSEFMSLLLRKLAKTVLRRNNLRFDEDENGLLIRDKRVYIVFMHDLLSLAKLLETPFSKVIDVVPDNVNDAEIIVDLLKIMKGGDISAFHVAHIDTLDKIILNYL